MNTPNNTLTKICSNCGQRKPLSAFLQLAGGLHGYSNICSACRKTAPAAPKDEDNTRSTTGAKIDAKLKVKDALDKRESFKQEQEEYFEGREKREEKRINQIEKVGQVTEGEKKHRSFLDKRSFLSSPKKSSAPAAPFGGEKQKAEAGRIDFTESTADSSRVEGEAKKVQSPIYSALKDWLPGSRLLSATERALRQKNNEAKASGPADSVTDYVHKNTGPKSR